MAHADFARWTITITASYLLATTVLMATAAAPGRLWLMAAHMLLAAALVRLRRAPSVPLLRFLRDWHPILLFPLLYKEVEVLAAAVGDWRLTATIPVLEVMLFGGQPSLYLSQRWPFALLSEYLHFCYIAYVVIIPAVAGYWYFGKRRAAFGELVLTLSVVMFASYLVFILLPVDSPYYLSSRLGPPLSDHFFFTLVHAVSERGGARGGAFPSAHVSGAAVVLLVAWRHQRQLAFLLAPLIAGVVVATVYGRFHYAIDSLAGLLLGAVAVWGCRRASESGFADPGVAEFGSSQSA